MANNGSSEDATAVHTEKQALQMAQLGVRKQEGTEEPEGPFPAVQSLERDGLSNANGG